MKLRFPRLPFVLLFPLALQTGCATVPDRSALPTEATPYTIHVMHYGWHTALLLDGRSALAMSSKLGRDFHDQKYLLVGWGDGEYFVQEHPPWSKAVKALVASDYPALQVGGRDANPPLGVAPGDSTPLAITARGYRQLVAYIDRSIAADAQGQPIYLGTQETNPDRFYQATGSYSMFNNCNSWVVGALRAADMPISGFNLTARSVFEQVRQISALQRQD